MSIQITGLCKAFGPKAVLCGFTLCADGPLVLMGPSGCGKTTLLRILMGLERADAGEVTGVGRVAAVFQENRLCPQLTAAANITLPGGDPKTAERELRALGFADAELALPAAQLRALLCPQAQTLLLDEPFTGMDAELVAQAAKTIVRLAAGRDTLLVTHDAAAAALLGWPVVQLQAMA